MQHVFTTECHAVCDNMKHVLNKVRRWPSCTLQQDSEDYPLKRNVNRWCLVWECIFVLIPTKNQLQVGVIVCPHFFVRVFKRCLQWAKDNYPNGRFCCKPMCSVYRITLRRQASDLPDFSFVKDSVFQSFVVLVLRIVESYLSNFTDTFSF